MTDEHVLTAGDANDEKEDALWPLSYRLQTLQQPTFVRWWSYKLYQNLEGENVQVLYSNNKARSEELARKFLDEPVVGFDMEWPCFPGQSPPLQKRIGLIQVASEDTIALFHIGVHVGKTADDLIAPSLRKLIESPGIAKTGVGILGADFARLRRFFGLNPRGAFELSHFDRLVRFAYVPHLLNTKMVSLANLVENHLGLPLAKGPVRTSNWSRPLNDEQKNYAASDAYAGFMLFHCMNAKRLALRPVPNFPIFAEQYPRKAKGAKGFAPITTLMLHPTEEGGTIIAANKFFCVKKDEANSEEKTKEETDTAATPTAGVDKKRIKKTPSKTTQDTLEPAAQILYNQLAERRKAVAQANGLPVYLIANNSVLHGLAQRSPQSDEELLQVKGIGKVSAAKFGAEWLEVIARHLATHGTGETTAGLSTTSTEPERTIPSTPARKSLRRTEHTRDSSDSSSAFGSPIHRTPALHTGLSFTLAETTLNTCDSTDVSLRYPSTRRPTAHEQNHYPEGHDLTGAEPYDHGLARDVAPAGTVGPLSGASAKATPAEDPARWKTRSSSSSEDSLIFITPPSRSPFFPKRKRSETRLCTATPNRTRT